jgi:predicted metalloprotease
VRPAPLARRVGAAILVALLAVLLGGCVLPGGDRGGAPQEGPSATRQARPKASGESLEGRFSHETMDAYVDAIIPMITQWMGSTWQRMPYPRVVYVPSGATGPEECTDPAGRPARYSARSYEYCGANGTVYVGQDILWIFYTRTGDAGPAVGLAHEFGHHIQQQVGVPPPTNVDESTRYENQADCIAGVWTRYTDEQGWLEYPDDIQDIESLFPLIGSAEGPGRDHGTGSERAQSFQQGFDGGVNACSAFYPSAPLGGPTR